MTGSAGSLVRRLQSEWRQRQAADLGQATTARPRANEQGKRKGSPEWGSGRRLRERRQRATRVNKRRGKAEGGSPARRDVDLRPSRRHGLATQQKGAQDAPPAEPPTKSTSCSASDIVKIKRGKGVEGWTVDGRQGFSGRAGRGGCREGRAKMDGGDETGRAGK